MANAIEVHSGMEVVAHCKSLQELAGLFPGSQGLQLLRDTDATDQPEFLGALNREIGSGVLPLSALVVAASLSQLEAGGNSPDCETQIANATRMSLRVVREHGHGVPLLSYAPWHTGVALIPETSGLLTDRPVGIDWDGRRQAKLTVGFVGEVPTVHSWEPAAGLALGRDEVEALAEQVYAYPRSAELGDGLDTNALRTMARMATNAATLEALNTSMQLIGQHELRYPNAHYTQIEILLLAFGSIIPRVASRDVDADSVVTMLPAFAELDPALAKNAEDRLLKIAS